MTAHRRELARADRVLPGLWRLRLPLPWPGVPHGNAYAIAAGWGTITHHHAVGRDHRPWYDRQRPDPFALALRAAKAAVDPAGVLNPGVLVDPL